MGTGIVSPNRVFRDLGGAIALRDLKDSVFTQTKSMTNLSIG
jgi:hypothetical protein